MIAPASELAPAAPRFAYRLLLQWERCGSMLQLPTWRQNLVTLRFKCELNREVAECVCQGLAVTH
jgi:hypothetical protein